MLQVLIPLLVDVPLWAIKVEHTCIRGKVLIPLLVDDPLRAGLNFENMEFTFFVLIPLLVDDPLRGVSQKLKEYLCKS